MDEVPGGVCLCMNTSLSSKKKTYRWIKEASELLFIIGLLYCYRYLLSQVYFAAQLNPPEDQGDALPGNFWATKHLSP